MANPVSWPRGRALALTLLVLGCASSSPHLVDDFSARSGDGLIQAVVEIPAGTNAKWEVDKDSGSLIWEQEDGRPRVVQYLAYPGNYGMIPRTSLPEELGGDGDPLDVLVLGPRIARGTLLRARPIGVLRLIDEGERDDKVLAVPLSGPLSDVSDVDQLDARYPGASVIVETWFTSYKGPGRVTSDGFADAAAALRVIEEASRYYEQRHRPPAAAGSPGPPGAGP